MLNIDWESDFSHILINPKTPILEKERLEELTRNLNLDSHVYLASSGSTSSNNSELKFVALSKKSIISSSQAVNDHICCVKSDIILNTLPIFHIGGLSIFSRAYLSGSKVINIYSNEFKWKPSTFIDSLSENNVTITSLVPTQVYDLVVAKYKSPKYLRVVFVGGGGISKELYENAKILGWNLLPTYGMTECASQVATAPLNFKWETEYPKLKVLNHLNVFSDENKVINISGKSILSGYILKSNDKVNFIDPKIVDTKYDREPYIKTTDLGLVELKNDGTYLSVIGRCDDVVKIGGENVSLTRLDSILFTIKTEIDFRYDAALFLSHDQRLGKVVSLAVENEQKVNVENLLSLFNKRVFPFERIRNVFFIPLLPRTELGKLKRNFLTEIFK